MAGACREAEPGGVAAGRGSRWRGREDETGYVQLNGPTFRRGQTLRIVEGPMTDTQAIFEEQVDGNRAILLVSLLGRLVRTRMPLRQVEAA